MWEARHGFPAPARLAGGHRRYGERDVELVRAVVRAARRRDCRSARRSIGRGPADTPAPASIFAGLARRRPDLQSMTLDQARAAGAVARDRGRASGGCARRSAGRELSDRPVLPAIRAALARARAQRARRGRAGGLQAAAPACTRTRAGAGTPRPSARPRVGDRDARARRLGLPCGLGDPGAERARRRRPALRGAVVARARGRGRRARGRRRVDRAVWRRTSPARSTRARLQPTVPSSTGASRGGQAGPPDARLPRHGLIQISVSLRIMSVTFHRCACDDSR